MFSSSTISIDSFDEGEEEEQEEDEDEEEEEDEDEDEELCEEKEIVFSTREKIGSFPG